MKVEYAQGAVLESSATTSGCLGSAPGLLLSYGVVGCGVWGHAAGIHTYVTFGDVGGHHGCTGKR